MNKNEIESILALAKNEKYDEFINKFKSLSDEEQDNKVLMMAYADSLYEVGKDTEAISAYIEFAEHYPNGKPFNVALFGVSMSLKNIGLQEDALSVLRKIPDDHPDVKEEIEHSYKLLSEMKAAKSALSKLKI